MAPPGRDVCALAVLVALLGAAPPAIADGEAPPPGAPTSLRAAAEALAVDVGPPLEGRRALRLAVEARAPALAAPVETAIAGSLSARGFAVTPHRGRGDAEASARADGQDWLLRVRAGLVPGRRELALVGELIPAWPSFFLQRQPGARALPPRIVQSRAPADPATLLLARESRPAGSAFASVRRIARVDGRALALAVGEPEEPGRPAIVLATPEALLVLDPSGAPVARRDADAARLRPVRGAAATLAVGDFGGGRIAIRRAGAPRAEVLSLRGGRLEPAGAIDGAPLCAGAAGRLFGVFVPGTGVLEDRLAPLADPGAPLRSPRTLYGAAAAPGGGPVAFAVLGTDLRLLLLGPDLTPATALPLPPAPGERGPTGTGFALADLDGDGTAEVVASSADGVAIDRIRVLAPLVEAPVLFVSPPVEGAILAGGAGDLTGDGVDDAVLAAVSSPPGGAPATDLLLVSADPRLLEEDRP